MLINLEDLSLNNLVKRHIQVNELDQIQKLNELSHETLKKLEELQRIKNYQKSKHYQNYKKGRDHCHYTGIYRGTAHYLCNLRY